MVGLAFPADLLLCQQQLIIINNKTQSLNRTFVVQQIEVYKALFKKE